jgi:hypothetical protein
LLASVRGNVDPLCPQRREPDGHGVRQSSLDELQQRQTIRIGRADETREAQGDREREPRPALLDGCVVRSPHSARASTVKRFTPDGYGVKIELRWSRALGRQPRSSKGAEGPRGKRPTVPRRARRRRLGALRERRLRRERCGADGRTNRGASGDRWVRQGNRRVDVSLLAPAAPGETARRDFTGSLQLHSSSAPSGGERAELAGHGAVGATGVEPEAPLHCVDGPDAMRYLTLFS